MTLSNNTKGTPFDERIHQNAGITDFKMPLIQSFLKDSGNILYKEAEKMPFKKLLRQMKIVGGSEEYLEPLNVGLLFFNDNPQQFIPMSQIETIWFKDTSSDHIFEEKSFQGPIDHQIRTVMNYINNTALSEYVRKLPDRARVIRFFNFPHIAVQESIVNAVCHRNYEIRKPIEIRLHPDRIEIQSYPGPDSSIKQADMNNGILEAEGYRNRRICEVLEELELTQGRRKGIPRIKWAMKRNGSPPPIFKTDGERTYFQTILAVHPGVDKFFH